MAKFIEGVWHGIGEGLGLGLLLGIAVLLLVGIQEHARIKKIKARKGLK